MFTWQKDFAITVPDAAAVTQKLDVFSPILILLWGAKSIAPPTLKWCELLRGRRVPLSSPSIATQAMPRSQGSWNMFAGGGSAATGRAPALLAGTSEISNASRLTIRRKFLDFMITSPLSNGRAIHTSASWLVVSRKKPGGLPV